MGCTSIYRPLSYPLIPCEKVKKEREREREKKIGKGRELTKKTYATLSVTAYRQTDQSTDFTVLLCYKDH